MINYTRARMKLSRCIPWFSILDPPVHETGARPTPPGQQKRASKAELIDACNKQPKCRAKMQAAKSGKKPKNRKPAAREESPEDKALKQLPKPAQAAPGRQRSQNQILRPELTTSLWEWLNPFAVTEAFAQSAVSIQLDPINNRNSTPLSYLYLYGNNTYGSNWFYLSGYWDLNSPNTENQPYAYVRFSAPTAGYYIIDFRAFRGKAKLRHQYNGPIIETWDFLSQGCSPCNYATLEYLEVGNHYFYFWPEGNSAFYFGGVGITSYP